MEKILILNIGGTFGKVYNPLNGALEVANTNKIAQTIIKKIFKYNILPTIKGMIFKDSLNMDNNDREKIYNFCKKTKFNKILIIHGTDTIDKTAKKISTIKNKAIILTGAMQPYNIDKTEAVGNLMMSYGYLLNKKSGVYICLNGIVAKWNKIVKDRKKGYFKKVSYEN